MKKMIVCGDRNWDNFDIMKSYLEMAKMLGFDTIIEGEAQGADSMARDIGMALGFNVIKEPADWEHQHRAAGPIRNAKMLTHQPSLCLAFHPNILESKGTLDMITKARVAGVPVILVDLEENLQISIPQKVTWLTTESMKAFLINLVLDTMNTVSNGFTRDDAEEFLKGRGTEYAVHKQRPS